MIIASARRGGRVDRRGLTRADALHLSGRARTRSACNSRRSSPAPDRRVASSSCWAPSCFAVVNLFRRLRRSSGEERLQFRWFAYSTVLILLLFIPSAFLPSVPVSVQLLGALALFTLPVAVGISIMRYRLYDIDVVIRRPWSTRSSPV